MTLAETAPRDRTADPAAGPAPPAAFEARVQKELPQIRELVRKANITVD